MNSSDTAVQDPPDLLTVSQIMASAEKLWPAHTAESWDVVGLTVGKANWLVNSILWAVDPVRATVEEAQEDHVSMLITHHPLLLKSHNSVANFPTMNQDWNSTHYKNDLVISLVEAQIALASFHTNADHAVGGTSAALAHALGVIDSTTLIQHPDIDNGGIGIQGSLGKEMTLEDLADKLAQILPPTAGGIKVAGERTRPIEKVALVGGAGDSFFPQVRASEVDVYITSDLRHHPVSEARELAELTHSGLAFIDISHYAAESVWLKEGALALNRQLQADYGHQVSMTISKRSTDPWTFVEGAVDQSKDKKL